MTILSRVNDSKDGQIQSKLERSVCGIGLHLLVVGCANGTTLDSGNSRSSVKLVGRKRMPGTSRENPRWRQPKTPSATNVSGRMTTRAKPKGQKHHRSSARNYLARRKFLLPNNFPSFSFFFPPFYLCVFLGLCSTLLYCNICLMRSMWGNKSCVRTIKSWRLAPKKNIITHYLIKTVEGPLSRRRMLALL